VHLVAQRTARREMTEMSICRQVGGNVLNIASESRRLYVDLTESLASESTRVSAVKLGRYALRVEVGSFISPRISIDRLQFTNAETCWIYRHSATLSLRNPLPSVIFSSTRRPDRLRPAPLRFAPRLAHIFTLQSQRGLGTSLVIIVN